VKVLDARQRILGDEHPDTLSAMSNLAWIYHSLGQMKDAEALRKKVLDAHQRILGDEHPDTRMAMDNLASTYRGLGQTKDAEALDAKVLKAHEKLLGDEHLNALGRASNLALTDRALVSPTIDAAPPSRSVPQAPQTILGNVPLQVSAETILALSQRKRKGLSLVHGDCFGEYQESLVATAEVAQRIGAGLSGTVFLVSCPA
jgi:tetratricopeptide (TPR) repeat protein